MREQTTTVRMAQGLEEPASRGTLERLRAAGLLDGRAYDAALRLLHPPGAWWMWTDRLLLGLGTALALAGVIFFFAYNWVAMGPWLKLGAIQAGLVSCAVGGAWIGTRRLGGKLLTLAASVLIGVFLAVFGQVYQTGADTFEFFATWAALVFGYAILARFSALWLAWLVLADLALGFYGTQASGLRGIPAVMAGTVLVGTLNLVALALREAGLRCRLGEFGTRWLRTIPLATACGTFSFPVWIALVDDGWSGDSGAVAGVALGGLALTLGGAAWFYRTVAPDLIALGIAALTTCGLVLSVIGRALFESADRVGSLLVFGVCCLGVLGSAAAVLRTAARSVEMTHA